MDPNQLIRDILTQNLPQKRKMTPSSWISFDAVCCVHNAESQDKRQRGGIRFDTDGSIQYNCFNCGFKARYWPNSRLTYKFRNLLKWLNITLDDIRRINLAITTWKHQHGVQEYKPSDYEIKQKINFKEEQLPKGSIPFYELLDQKNPPLNFLKCAEYLLSRGDVIFDNYEYYWTSKTQLDLNNRILIPFYYKDKLVGWTARYANKIVPNDKPRYFTEIQNNYLFNPVAITKGDRKFIIIVEGPFDAIAIDCVGALGNKINKTQIEWLNSSDRQKIVLPDREMFNPKKTKTLIDIAKKQNWYVSFPIWNQDVKDAADAVKQYGIIYTLKSILENRTKNSVKIEVERRRFK